MLHEKFARLHVYVLSNLMTQCSPPTLGWQGKPPQSLTLACAILFTTLPISSNLTHLPTSLNQQNQLTSTLQQNLSPTLHCHNPCIKPCERLAACGHACPYPCHHGANCPPCGRQCWIGCAHRGPQKVCKKPCAEVCTPCAEPCVWKCIHQGGCSLPCGAPCDRWEGMPNVNDSCHESGFDSYNPLETYLESLGAEAVDGVHNPSWFCYVMLKLWKSGEICLALWHKQAVGKVSTIFRRLRKITWLHHLQHHLHVIRSYMYTCYLYNTNKPPSGDLNCEVNHFRV